MGQDRVIFDKELDDAATKAGGVVFAVIIIITLTLDIINGYFASTNTIEVATVVVSIAVLSAAQALNLFQINEHRLFLSIAFTGLYLFMILLIFPVASTYIIFGLHLVYQTHYWYGRRASVAMVIAIATTMALSVPIQGRTFDLTTIADMIRSFSVLVIGAIALINLLEIAMKQLNKDRLNRKIADAEKRKVLNLMNSMSDAVIATDQDGRITEYNAAALTMLDMNQDIHGQMISDAFNFHNLSGENVDLLAEAHERDKAFSRADLIHSYNEKDQIRMLVIVNPLRSSYREGTNNGYTFVIRDITKEKSIEAERNQFISVLSHELRTPVTIVEGNIEVAQMLGEKNNIDEDIKKPLNEAHKNALYLSQLINDLVVMAMSEQDKTKIKHVDINLRTLLEEVKAEYEEQAQEKGLDIVLELDGKALEVHSSPTFIKEIVRHLTSNAVKYTKEGTVTIKTRGLDSGHVIIDIIDTGIGIAKTDYKHVFQKFFQAQDFQTRDSGGTGLGLFVSKQLAEQIDAKLSFKSSLGEGSTFSLLIPPQDSGETQ